MHCPRCGSPVSKEDTICNICGSTLLSSPGKKLAMKGKILGDRYEILEKVKTGGMGILYRVRDKRLERIFALKEMRETFENEEEKKNADNWFRREAKILCNLRHSNIPVVIDFFSEEGRNYLVMDYIEGSPPDKGKLPLSEDAVREFALTALGILKYMHGHNIVHRDIKLEHFLKEKGTGKLFLIDFGTARTITPGEKKTAIGTQGYASPEHYEGKADARSDIYSLGATLHHLLTGIDPRDKPPFDFKPIPDIAPNTSHRLAVAVGIALSYKSVDRFQNAQEMIDFITSTEPVRGIPIPPKTTGKLKDKAHSTRLLHIEEPEYEDYSKIRRTNKMIEPGQSKTPFAGVKGELFRRIYAPHLGWIASIEFVPPGNIIAIAYCEGQVVLQDVYSGEQVGILERIGSSSAMCTDIAVSTDGQTLAQSFERQIILWDLATNRRLGKFTGHTRTIRKLCFVSEVRLISGSDDQQITLWDTHLLEKKAELTGHDGGVTAIAASSDENLILLGCRSGMLKLWEHHSLDKVLFFPESEKAHRGEVSGASFSPSADMLVTVGADGVIRLWKVEKSHPAYLTSYKSIRIGKGATNASAFSPKQDIFIVGGGRGRLEMWDAINFRVIKRLREHENNIISTAFSQNGRYFASASEEGRVVIWV
ncbi:MAG: protein kinase [Candidatus Eremiobacteraeota bacterium]|nr:protein kinase [Candidatus Eremiobacteraeota bacterium]